MKNKKNLPVKKITISNRLIETKLDLSSLEHKIFLKCLSEMGFMNTELKEHELLKSEMISDFGLSKKSGYEKIKKAVQDLYNRVLIFDKPDSLDHVHIFSKISYMKNNKAIRFVFHPYIKEQLIELKEKFTTFELKHLYRLETKYNIKIYMLLKQYSKCKRREITVEGFKFYLGLNDNIPYGNIKRILVSVEKDLSRKVDLSFSFEEIKTGKKVTSIIFSIEDKSIPEIEQYNKHVSKEAHDIAEDIYEKILVWEQAKSYTIRRLDRNPDLRKNRTIGFLLNCIKVLGLDTVGVLWDEEQYGENPNMFDFLMKTLPSQVKLQKEESF